MLVLPARTARCAYRSTSFLRVRYPTSSSHRPAFSTHSSRSSPHHPPIHTPPPPPSNKGPLRRPDRRFRRSTIPPASSSVPFYPPTSSTPRKPVAPPSPPPPSAHKRHVNARDAAVARALLAAEAAARSTSSTQRASSRPTTPSRQATSQDREHPMIQEALELQVQIAQAQSELAALQAKLNPSGHEVLQRVSSHEHTAESDEEVLAHVASMFEKTPSAELAGRTQLDLPRDQRKFEAYANQRLQGLISRAQSVLSTHDKEQEEEDHVSASEAGYANDSVLDRPLVYDVYRDPKLPQQGFALVAPGTAEKEGMLRVNRDEKQETQGVDAQKAEALTVANGEERGAENWVKAPANMKVPLRVLEQRGEPARLGYGLDRILFNPGVAWLQDPRTKHYNYEPQLRKVSPFELGNDEPPSLLPIQETVNRVQQKEEGRDVQYLASSFALAGALSHLFFLVMGWAYPNFAAFGQGFTPLQALGGYTMGARSPAQLKMVYHDETDTYSVEEIPPPDTPETLVLSSLGKSLQNTLLTSEPNSDNLSTSNSYALSEFGNLLIHSPVPCADPRLPHRTFDVRARGVVAVRQDGPSWVEGSGYQIRQLNGVLDSYERESFDLVRSSMLTYLLQARMGDMDGTFVAYHNTATVFGFEYFSRESMAETLVGGNTLFEKVFTATLDILQGILRSASTHFPKQSLDLSIEARADKVVVVVSQFGAPATERSNILLEVYVDRWINSKYAVGPFEKLQGGCNFEVDYGILSRTDLGSEAVAHLGRTMARSRALVAAMYLPRVDATNERERYLETVLAQNPKALQKYLRERHALVGKPKVSKDGVETPREVDALRALSLKVDEGHHEKQPEMTEPEPEPEPEKIDRSQGALPGS